MRSRRLGVAATLLTAVASGLLWSRLPPEVVTHWNLRGEPDGWMSRGAAALLGPALVLVFTGIAQVLPTIDPRRENYARFSSAYWVSNDT
jgi:uncharacterized membrane protein